MSKKAKPLDVYDTMAAAAGGLGVSIDTLKAAKAEGCPAFKGSRVNRKEFLDWTSNRPTPTEKRKSLKDQKTEEEIRKLRIANDAKEKKVVERSKVCATIERLHRRIFPMLETKLTKEYPQAVSPSPEDIPRCRIIGQNLMDGIMREWRSFADEWR